MNQPSPRISSHIKRRARARRGYTLPELMVGLGVFTLLLGGVLGVFILMLRLSASVTGATLASADAGDAAQRVTADLREANSFALLDDATHDGTDAKNNVIVTGIKLTFPAAYVTTESNGKFTYKVYSGGATTTKTLTGVDIPYNRASASTTTLSFYRANWNQPDGANGTPNPTTGHCLWATGTENGVVLNDSAGDGGLPVIKTLASTPDAVQFIQPYLGATAIPNEAQFKIVSGQYTPINGSASSDSSAGGTVALTGTCVYMRDHNPSAPPNTGANGRKQYFGG